MIGRLSGILESIQPPVLLIEVSGLGYEVESPFSTIFKLPALKQKITLFTHLYVREDQQVLYGFITEKERFLFRNLIKISGIGPKMALTILSGIEVDDFIRCVHNRDALPLTRLPGVGKKTAERLMIELAGKLEESTLQMQIDKNTTTDKTSAYAMEQDAIAALISLGYKPAQAKSAITDALIHCTDKTSEALIRLALQNLVSVKKGNEKVL